MISYFFKTYGCQANVADSQGLMQNLQEFGCTEAASEESADLLVVNTCAVREKAEQKLYSYLGQLSDLKRARPYIKIGVIGCVASYRKEELYKRFDAINFVYGAREELPILQTYLADLVVQLETTKQMFVNEPDKPLRSYQDRNVKAVVQNKKLSPTQARLVALKGALAALQSPKEVGKSFVNIMTGCNKYCTYCIVPFTRGREVSYPMAEIIDRVKHDIANGAKEVMLIGQNVNSYADPSTGAMFPELLRQIAAIEGEFWVRYISPHPQDMTVELFDVMKEHRPKIAASIHFPLQAGSDTVLQAMNRNYTTQTYMEKIQWIWERMPDATISSDIIVGFPGETDEDFAKTMEMLERVKFDLIYSFIYSPRKFTKAFKMEDSCPADVKQQRLEILQKRQMEIAAQRNKTNIGKSLLCLVEKRLEHGKLLARTEGNIRVVFDGGDDLIGTFTHVTIESAGPAQMLGVLSSDIFLPKQKEFVTAA